MRRVSWLFASVLLWGCHSGIAPGAIRVDVALPKALQASCIEVGARPATGGAAVYTDPIPREDRDRLTVAVYPGKTLQGKVVLSARAFADAKCSGTPIEAREGTSPVSFDPGEVTSAQVELWALTYAAPPHDTSADGTLAVQVEVVGGSGEAVSAATGDVTLALRGGPAGAVLDGSVESTLQAGIARFDNLAVHRGGAGYRLEASFPGLPSITSAPFDISPGAPLISFSKQPSDAVAGMPWSVAVRVADAYGNALASDTSIRLGLEGDGGIALQGVTSEPMDGGLATFAGLSIQKAGTGYRLRADSTGVPAATSNPFDVLAGPPSPGACTLTIQPSTLPADGTSTASISVFVVDAFGNPIPDAGATLAADGRDNRFDPVSGHTDSSGYFRATLASTRPQTEQVSADLGGFGPSGEVTFSLPACNGIRFVDGGTLSGAGRSPIALAEGDLNGDGRPDLAVADKDSKQVIVFAGQMDGGFKAPFDVTTAAFPQGVLMADVGGDGLPDLVASERGANQVEVFPGDGDGGLGSGQVHPVGQGPIAMVSGEIDGGAILAVGNFGDDDVSIFFGHPDGTLSDAGVTLAAGTEPVALATGDFDQNGLSDLVVADYGGGGVSTLSNDGATLPAPVFHATGAHPGAVVVGTFDSAPGVDLAVANNGDGTGNGGITLLSGDGAGGFSLGSTLNPERSFGKVVAADLDANGSADLVAVETDEDWVSVFIRDGGTFDAPMSFPTGDMPSDVKVVDVNGDLRPDLVVPNQDAGTLTVLLETCGG